MYTSFPIAIITIIGAFIAGLSLGGFAVAVISETIAAKKRLTLNRNWEILATGRAMKILDLEMRLRESNADAKKNQGFNVNVKNEIAFGPADAQPTPEELARVAREAFLMRGPEYRQIGPLAFVKFEHLSLLRRMGWILRQGAGAPAPGWMITDHDGNMVLESDDISDLMRRATDLSKQGGL